jgi:hypothetical protein
MPIDIDDSHRQRHIVLPKLVHEANILFIRVGIWYERLFTRSHPRRLLKFMLHCPDHLLSFLPRLDRHHLPRCQAKSHYGPNINHLPHLVIEKKVECGLLTN